MKNKVLLNYHSLKHLFLFLHIFTLPLARFKVLDILSLDTIFITLFAVSALLKFKIDNLRLKSMIPIVICIFLFQISFFISSFINGYEAHLGTLSVSIYTILIIILFVKTEDIDFIFKFIFLATLILIIVWFIRGFLIHKKELWGFYFRYPGMIRVKILSYSELWYWRNYSVFNISGSFSIWFTFVFGVVLYKKMVQNIKSYRNSIFLIIICLVILLSFSRNAILSTLLTVSLFFIFKYRFKAVSIIIILVLFTFIAIMIYNNNAKKNFFDITDRIELIQEMKPFIRDNILFGVGSLKSKGVKHEVHNTFLMLLVNNGIITLILFLNLILILIISFFKTNINRENILAFVSLIMLLFSISFFSGLYAREVWFLLGIIFVIQVKTQKINFQRQ